MKKMCKWLLFTAIGCVISAGAGKHLNRVGAIEADFIQQGQQSTIETPAAEQTQAQIAILIFFQDFLETIIKFQEEMEENCDRIYVYSYYRTTAITAEGIQIRIAGAPVGGGKIIMEIPANFQETAPGLYAHLMNIRLDSWT